MIAAGLGIDFSRPFAVIAACLASAAFVFAPRVVAQTPYEAFVNTDEVYVRSGPGKNYYPTQKLARGDRVEVYRHDPGGWFAIRPPEGSFSWVSGEFVKPGENGLGTIIGDRVVARVGSVFSDIRDVIQLRMNRGEDIEILEAKQFNPGPAAQTWYKIHPPSGEFRWIHGKFLSRDLAETAPPESGPRRNLLISPEGEEDEAERHGLLRQDEDAELRLIDHEVAESEREEIEEKRERRITARRNAELELDERDIAEQGELDHESPPRIAQRNSPRHRKRVMSREEELSYDLDQIDLELSAMVAEESSTWVFDDLSARATAALERGETAVERGRARLILNKIEKFSDIKRRMDAVAQITAETDRINRPFTVPQSAYGAIRDDFDGTGRLARVVSPRKDVPGYALTDAAGEIRYFVTPAPGVNLRHYVGQQVGINGNIGYVPDLDRQSVTARRITVLPGDTIRR